MLVHCAGSWKNTKLGRGLAGAMLCAAAEMSCSQCHQKHEQHERQIESHVLPDASGTYLASATAGVSVLAAAAPALCAVHCAAMPVIAIALPSLQRFNGAGGVCMHGVARKLAIYVVVPLGLVSNAVGYSNHGSVAVTSSSLLGVSCVTAAATVKAVASHRNTLNGAGCLLMLGAAYCGRQLEQELGHNCCSSSH